MRQNLGRVQNLSAPEHLTHVIQTPRNSREDPEAPQKRLNPTELKLISSTMWYDYLNQGLRHDPDMAV